MADTTQGENNSPKHLNPSKLGTKEYWDQTYQEELDSGVGQDEQTDLTNLDSWFIELDVPLKVLEYLTSDDFPFSPNNPNRTIEKPTVLDLGSGNGSTLFELVLDGGYQGRLIGVDYSQQSVDLAKRLWSKHVESSDAEALVAGSISFEKLDLLNDRIEEQAWWPDDGFDLVLDKGTFDAVSLAAQTTILEDKEVRIAEAYPGKVIKMVKPGAFLLITSVNWTEDELVEWFTKGTDVQGELEVYGRVDYPVYGFGGQQGAGVVSVCFRRVTSAMT